MNIKSIINILVLLFSFVFSALIQNSYAVESERPFHVYNPAFSPARNWNEALLSSIARDYARPTVHARNLFHSGILIYDSWAFYDSLADTYLLGRQMNTGVSCMISSEHKKMLKGKAATNLVTARQTTMSYAMYRFINRRFRIVDDSQNLVQQSPRFAQIALGLDALMDAQGFDKSFTSTDITGGSFAALGNYLADCMIAYGRSDGANEVKAYANSGYAPINPPLNPLLPGVGKIVDPNRWQPLNLAIAFDQAGNPVNGNTPFLGANWGLVQPFSLSEDIRAVYARGGINYPVYFSPEPPPSIDAQSDVYQWNHLKVAIWSSHLDTADGAMIDISPNSVGNTAILPTTLPEYEAFYSDAGKVQEMGRMMNPKTGQPYTSQMVLRGDFTRVLAEFWADGPSSLTPPGHWFRILNQSVLDSPHFSPKFRGAGPELEKIEWEAKAYFLLGASMHDAAITAWGMKGWFDSARPITAIRHLASLGQSDSAELPKYSPSGIHLKLGLIEQVKEGDPLAGEDNVNVGEIKIFAWRGPQFIAYDSDNAQTQKPINNAGVGWILAKNWWPYQRPTFVTPPFAGYISGHSTFSRTAAEVLTYLTGDEYFPGGLGEYVAKKNEFLVFEKGPRSDITLQWATYRDASDQCSLSRIWGGIHPPIDDIPGRKLGIKISERSIALAKNYFDGTQYPNELLPAAPAAVVPPKKKKGGFLDWSTIVLGLAFGIAQYCLPRRLIFYRRHQYEGN